MTKWQVRFSVDICKAKNIGKKKSKYTLAIHEGDLGVIIDTVESFSEKHQFSTH